MARKNKNNKTNLVIFVPKELGDFLLAKVDGYDSLSERQQLSLLELIWCNVGSKRHQHNEYSDCFSITSEMLGTKFGRGKFESVMAGLSPRLIDRVGPYSASAGSTYPYQFTSDLERLISKFVMSIEPGKPLTMINGSSGRKKISVGKNAILSKDKKQNTAKTKLKINPLCPINTGMLSDTLEDLYAWNEYLYDGKPKPADSTFVDLDEWIGRHVLPKSQHSWFYSRIVQSHKLLILANNTGQGGGKIPMRYREADSGRLYGVDVNLQNVSRVIRDAALCGNYDYDIENCHYSLFSQLAAKGGFDTRAINYYLANKKSVRETIAENIGITLKQVKTCLIAIMYGAKASVYYKTAIPQVLGSPEKATALYHHPIFHGLLNDIENGRPLIINATHQHRGMYMNAMGKGISNGVGEKKILSHVLQGAEAKILNIVGELYSPDLLLLQHDGWVSGRPLDIPFMTSKVEGATGFKVDITEKMIVPSLSG